MKKQYFSPLFIEESEDPGIVLKPSEQTSGTTTMFTFSVSPDKKTLIDLWCDDIDLADMDTDDNLEITETEFDAWWAIHGN